MKKQGILNRELAGIFAKLGHTDQITIADCGLPIPEGVPCIDLSYKVGKPSFLEVLEVILEDLEVEKAFIATEIEDKNVALLKEIGDIFSTIEKVSHEELKKLTANSKVIIRTGEATPYANVILQSGVIF